MFVHMDNNLVAKIVDVLSAHQVNDDKFESTIYGVGTLSHYLMIHEIFDEFKNNDEDVAALIELLIVIQKDVPYLSNMGLKTRKRI
jgi:hypothetical protein